MAHWTNKIDRNEAVKVGEMIGIEQGTVTGKRSLIEKVMVALMQVIREPWFLNNADYDSCVDFYQSCQRAAAQSIP